MFVIVITLCSIYLQEIKFKSRTDTPDLKQKANQEENFECRRYKNRSRNTNFSFQHSSQKNRDTFDPFVSEDFQITPLKKYLKSDSPVSNSQLKKRRLSQSSSDRKDTVIPSSSKAKKAKTGLSCHYFTSTPLKGSNKTQEHRRSKQKFNLSAIERRFSPIDKLSKHIPELEDDFKYQPRPMVNTPETFNTKNQTPTFNVANMPAYEISGHDTSTTLNLTRNNKTPSEVSSISNLYESENIISGRKETSFLETVERSNVFLQCLSEDPTNVTLKSDSAFASNVTPKLENTTKITGGSDSSLMRYRQKFLQSEKVLKSHKQISDCNQIYSIPKPEVFTDETEKAKLTSPEFHYKPFRQEAYTKDKTLDIMKLYHKEKDITESRDSFHLNHTMTSEDMIVHTPVVTDHCLDESSSERKNSGGVAT